MVGGAYFPGRDRSDQPDDLSRVYPAEIVTLRASHARLWAELSRRGVALLKVTSLSKHFHAEPLFADVDLVLGPGDRVGLVGPNGTGKSTLLRVLTGQEPPSSGRVELGPDTRL